MGKTATAVGSAFGFDGSAINRIEFSITPAEQRSGTRIRVDVSRSEQLERYRPHYWLVTGGIVAATVTDGEIYAGGGVPVRTDRDGLARAVVERAESIAATMRKGSWGRAGIVLAETTIEHFLELRVPRLVQLDRAAGCRRREPIEIHDMCGNVDYVPGELVSMGPLSPGEPGVVVDERGIISRESRPFSIELLWEPGDCTRYYVVATKFRDGWVISIPAFCQSAEIGPYLDGVHPDYLEEKLRCGPVTAKAVAAMLDSVKERSDRE